MVGLVTSFGVGVVFGLALAAPPGPMNAVIAQESVLRGFLPGFKAGLGAMTADICFFLLALLGAVAVIDALPRLQTLMIGIGGLLMISFGYGAMRDATAGVDWESTETDGGKGFWKALALALTNPYQIVFWLTVGVGLLRPGSIDLLSYLPLLGDETAGLMVVRTGSPALLVGFFGGILLWIIGFPASLLVAGRRVDRFAPVIAYLSAVVLFAFGGWFLADATGRLL